MQLSNENDFRLGGWYVRPSLGHVEAGTRVDRLEPQVMRVLIALARRAGQTVGREQLIDEAWKGRVVTDDAIGRCVGQLRRVLEDKDQANVRIVTVPKIGYRLVVDGVDGSDVEIGASPSPLWRRWRWGSAASVAIAVLLGIYWYFPGPASPPESGVALRIRPLTSEPGLELNPAISPSGGTVAYVAQTESGNWDLFLRAVDADTSLRLTDDPAREHSPSWSADGSRLMFVRHDEHAADCGLFTLASTGGPARRVSDCDSRGVRGIDWSADGNRVAVVEEGAAFASTGRVISLEDGVATDIVAPDGATLGIEDLRFSPDGQWLAYSATFGLGAEDLYVENIDTGNKTRLTFDYLKIHGLDWAPDGEAIVITSNRGGPFSLWRVPVSGGTSQPLPTPFQNADSVSIARSGRLAVDEWRERTELVWVDQDTGQIEPSGLSGSATYEWGAAISPAGDRIAFVSDRSGAAEIWAAGLDGTDARRLSDFAGAYVQAPRWSPDGTRLAFAAPDERGVYQVFVVNAGSGEQVQVTLGDRHHRAPAWDGSGQRLYAPVSSEAGTVLAEIDLSNNAILERDLPDSRFAWADPQSGDLYLVRGTEPGLWQAQKMATGWAAPTRIIAELAPVDAENWLRTDDAIYFLRRRSGEAPELVRQELADGRQSVIARIADFLYKSGLAYDERNGRLLLSVIREQEADIFVADGVLRGQ